MHASRIDSISFSIGAIHLKSRYFSISSSVRFSIATFVFSIRSRFAAFKSLFFLVCSAHKATNCLSFAFVSGSTSSPFFLASAVIFFLFSFIEPSSPSIYSSVSSSEKLSRSSSISEEMSSSLAFNLSMKASSSVNLSF